MQHIIIACEFNVCVYVCVQNMVGRGEVDEDLEAETKEECEKYGKVIKCVIFEVSSCLCAILMWATEFISFISSKCKVLDNTAKQIASKSTLSSSEKYSSAVFLLFIYSYMKW